MASSNSQLPDGLIIYGPDANCTLQLCPVEDSVYGYRPNLPANIFFLVLFSISIPIQLLLGLRYRSWFYTIAIINGSITEILGYVGRVMLWNNPFSFTGFLLQIICIAFAPAFYAAAIYVTLSQVVRNLNPTLSRFSPTLYYWLFIPCDVISLCLQATGGALSSNSQGVSQAAIDISIAGLAFQVFTLTVFVVLAIDYGVRFVRSLSSAQDEPKRRLKSRFQVSVVLLALAVVLLWIRCCYRIYELSGGYSGPNIRNEGLFIGLESVMVLLACYVLLAAGPGLSRPAFTE